jgi:MFS family permease
MSGNSPAQPRAWYHGWNVVTACILSQVAANGLTYNTFSLFLRDWSAELHTPISRLQLSVAAMALVSAFLAPVVGALADKYPARRLFTFGLLGMALFYVAISAATQAWQIIALYGLLVPLALVLSTAVTTNALISRWFVRRLGLAFGLSAFGIGMAGVLLPPLIAALLPTVGWRLIWRGAGVLVAVVVMPLVVLVSRDRPTEAEGAHYLTGDAGAAGVHGHGAGQAHGDPAQGGAPRGSQLTWRDVTARKNFWLLVAIYLPMMALYGGCAQNLAPYAANHGLSSQAGGALLSVLSLSHVIATLVLGLVSDRFGNRLPFAALAVVMVIGAAVLAFSSSVPAMTMGCVLVGFGGGLFTLLASAIALEFGAAGVGRAFGLCMLFIPVTGLAPFIIAKTQENTGSYAPGLLSLAVPVIIAGVLALLLRERRDGPPTDATWPAAEPASSAKGVPGSAG